MRDDLVGFLVGALEAPEHEQIQQKLQNDAQLRRDLGVVQSRLTPLTWDKDEFSPPADLTSRTCEFVEDYIEDMKVEPASRSTAVYPAEALAAEQGGWTFSDFVVAAGICLAAACLFFPALLNSRYNARLVHCQNNMRILGQALNQYSENNNGYFPVVPAKGKLAVAGAYAALLREQGLIDEDSSRIFNCPARGKVVNIRIPLCKEVDAASGQRLVVLQKTMGGDYAYPLGYVENGKLKGIRNQGRSKVRHSL